MVAAVLIFSAILVFFLLPWWMQSPQGQIYALEHIQRQTGLQFTARRWTIGWFSPTTFEGLEISAPAGSAIKAEYLVTDLSLLDYLRGHWDLGTTIVTAPHISLAKTDIAPLSQAVASARGLRGSITLKGGNLSLLSSTPGRSLECTILEAQIPIASTDTAVHATFRGQCHTDGHANDINITTTLPPVENWLASEAWFKTHLNIFASGLPTSVVAEWAGLSPSWQNTLGQTIAITAIVGPMTANPNQQEFSLTLSGTEGNAKFAGQFIEQDGESWVMIRPPLGSAEFSGKLSGALPQIVSWLNPTLSSALSGRADISLQNLELPSKRLQAVRINGVMTTSSVMLAPDGVLGGILTVAGVPLPGPKPLAVALPPVRFTIDQGQTSCSDFQLIINRRRIRMSGNVALSGDVKLYAQVSAPSASPLSTATVTVPVRGTVDSPAVSAAE